MFKIVTAEQAVSLIKDGDCICVNSFLALSNAEAIHDAIYARFSKSGSPNNLTMVSSAGFGFWDENRNAEPYIRAGAVRKLILGHFGSMLSTSRLVFDNKFEAYNIPLGVLSHTIRAAAGGSRGYLSRVGLGIFVDPRLEGPGVNEISKDKLVEVATLDGEEYLYYKLPVFDAAIIKGTSVDGSGNITFENEYITADALSAAQAVKRNGGKVIVQVDRVIHNYSRPWDIIVPGILVDVVVVSEPELCNRASQTLSGDIHVPPTHMQYWADKLSGTDSKKRRPDDASADIIGRHAVRELKPGHIVNIGIGLPEMVSKFAAETGILNGITLTVEAGGIGGLPAAGINFGATIGADMICPMATQFDFYDGGGLDICFMGALEVDKNGNVNSHRGPSAFTGIGGFANITAATKTVIFCLTFNTKGLKTAEKGDLIDIISEGAISKFTSKIRSVSFSAEQALKNHQRVLYVTERCIFELTPKGLRLAEVYPGIDIEKDILNKLDFPLAE